jgi:hypothetical protein
MLSSGAPACTGPERVLPLVGGMGEHGGMRDDGEDEGRHGSPLPPAVVIADERGLDTPNCPDCLMRMEAEESAAGEPYWACTECGFVAIA